MTTTLDPAPSADNEDLTDRQLEALTDLTIANFVATDGYHSEAVDLYYSKLGYDPGSAAELFILVRQFLALTAAWHTLGHPPDALSLPEKAHVDGWHGFLIQTHDYAAFSDLMGVYVHHTTTARGQGHAVLRTLALLAQIFGRINNPTRADCPDCIIYGWY